MREYLKTYRKWFGGIRPKVQATEPKGNKCLKLISFHDGKKTVHRVREPTE